MGHQILSQWNKEFGMDVKQFEEIKGKIETLKEKKIRAETNLESIVAGWKKQYGITTVEEAQKKLDATEDAIEKNDAKIDDLYKELEGLTNWGLV
jgi:septal ring factor EnvC (AmiA/AmiB activator)